MFTVLHYNYSQFYNNERMEVEYKNNDRKKNDSSIFDIVEAIAEFNLVVIYQISANPPE